MTNVQLDRETVTSDADQTPGYCEGCPRCTNPEGPWCQTNHPETPGVHPLCHWCKHCVLRGTHVDDAEDVRAGNYASRNDYLN